MGQLYLTIGLAVLAAGLAGCAGSGESFDGEMDQNRKAPLSYYEATLRPSDFDQEVEFVQKTHSDSTSSVVLEIPRDSMVVEEEVSLGFRIQIFASASIDEANAARALALQKVGADSVYVVYDPPVYKVRVGDYSSRLDANRKLSALVDRGYPDAWIVSDRIVVRKTSRMNPVRSQKP